jgi:AraC-like DNA-binding protein
LSPCEVRRHATEAAGTDSMAKKAEWWEQTVPPIFPQTYLRVAQDRGADPLDLLDQAGLKRGFLEHPTELNMLQVQALVETVRAAVGDNGLGIDIGWSLPPTAYGSFGYALLCSETMGDVVDLTQRYWHMVGRGTSLTVSEDGDDCIMTVSILVPTPDELRSLIVETTFSSLYRGLLLLVGPQAEGALEVWFDFPPPPHADKARDVLGNVHYNMPANRLRFPRRLLDTKLGMYNPAALKFALEQLKREDAVQAAETAHIVGHVREKMIFDVDGYPGLESIARQLNMTPRTLRRRLDQEGTSFKRLMEEAKRRDALRLLDDYDLDIQRVAELLGYQDPANFTRAFRQWTGQTPSEYRATRRSG